MNKRKGLANYGRQSRTAAELGWEVFPSLSGAGTVGGLFATSLYSHHLPQSVTWGGGWEGVLQLAGDPLPLGGIVAGANFLPEAAAFWPRRATPPPTQTRTSGLSSQSFRWHHRGILGSWCGGKGRGGPSVWTPHSWLTGSASSAWHWAKPLQDSAPPSRGPRAGSGLGFAVAPGRTMKWFQVG